VSSSSPWRPGTCHGAWPASPRQGRAPAATPAGGSPRDGHGVGKPVVTPRPHTRRGAFPLGAPRTPKLGHQGQPAAGTLGWGQIWLPRWGQISLTFPPVSVASQRAATQVVAASRNSRRSGAPHVGGQALRRLDALSNLTPGRAVRHRHRQSRRALVQLVERWFNELTFLVDTLRPRRSLRRTGGMERRSPESSPRRMTRRDRGIRPAHVTSSLGPGTDRSTATDSESAFTSTHTWWADLS
jgi:hypothetical protein